MVYESIWILPIRSGYILDGFCSSAAAVYTAHRSFRGVWTDHIEHWPLSADGQWKHGYTKQPSTGRDHPWRILYRKKTKKQLDVKDNNKVVGAHLIRLLLLGEYLIEN